MDCNITKVFLDEWQRMCKFYMKNCMACPYSSFNNGVGITCDILAMNEPEEAIKIVQEWSDQNPVKTRLSVLKEQYPNTMLNKDDGLPYVCAGVLYGFETCEGEGNWDCVKCWNTPIK